MNRPVWLRVKVEDELLCRFRGAAMRTKESPSQVIRMLMEKFLEIERDRTVIDLTVWGNAIDRAAGNVLRERPEDKSAIVSDIDDEVTVARKLGWASPTFGRR